MREAVGGSFLFYIILGFLAVYIVFIGIIMNYAATYRASNYVITQLEQTEGKISRDEIMEGLRSRKYYNSLSIQCYDKDGEIDPVYSVTTKVTFEIPIINYTTSLNIRNETKAIYGASCNDAIVDKG